MRAIADIGVRERDIDRHCDPRGAPRPQSYSLLGPRPAAEAFHTEALGIVEIDADERIAARVAFDPDDIDAAFAELDARYLAGEAAAHAHTGRSSRRPTPRSTGASSPRRRRTGSTSTTVAATAFAPGELTAYIRAVMGPRAGHQHLHRGRASAERTSERSSPMRRMATSQEGFDAEWRADRLSSRSTAT